MRLSSSLLFLLCASVVVGCYDDVDEESGPDDPVTLYFEPVGYGQRGTMRDTTEIAIRSEEEWSVYRDSLRPVAPFRPVDFTQGLILLAALPQTTSGHSIDFVAVEEYDSVAVAEYVVSIPAEDCLTASVETVPFQAVFVRLTELPFNFTRDTEEYRCTFGRRR